MSSNWQPARGRGLLFLALTLVLLLPMLTACGRSYRVFGKVPSANDPPLEPGRSIYIVLAKDAIPFHREVARKIETTLRHKGFAPDVKNRADFYLSFEVGTQPLEMGESSWDHYLEVQVVDAGAARTAGQRKIVWRGWVRPGGGAVRRDPSSPIELLDHFILALFDHFPEHTGDKVLDVTLPYSDPRVEMFATETP